ncbi:DUF892 family protein [Anditalea andensis]|nr:DUF892 family protein [Anditalea andensis]
MIFEDHPSPKKLSDQDNPDFINYFLEELKGVFGTEKELLELLGRFQKQAFGQEFIKILVKYSQHTISNVERLENIFVLADVPIAASYSNTLKGMTEDGKEATLSNEPSLIKDLKLATLMAQFNYLNISQYTQLHSLSYRMQLEDITGLFFINLQEEKKMCDHLSSCIIKEVINKFPGLGSHY